MRFFSHLIALYLISIITGCAIQPEPLTSKQKQLVIESDNETLGALSTLPVNATLDFHDVAARAILFNRDRTIASLETQLAQMQSDTSVFEQLPTLVQRLNRDTRNNLQASSSVGITDGVVDDIDSDANYVVSSDKSSYKRDLRLAINLLDYGLAVTKSEQLGNNLLITREKERQALQAIFEQAQSLYWRAVASENLLNKLPQLLNLTDEVIIANRQIQEEQLQDPIQALTFKRELLDVKRTLLDLQLDLLSAKNDLAIYIGLRPDVPFSLADNVKNRYVLPQLSLSLEDMETLALLNRSDYEQIIYETNNVYLASRASFMQALPQITLSSSLIYDNSPYVLNQGWRSLGAEFSWNVLNLFRLGSIEDSNLIQQQLIDEKRVQMALQILGVTHNAKLALEQNLQRFTLSAEYVEVSTQLLMQLESMSRVNRSGQLTIIKERLNTLLSEHRKNLAYADVLTSFATNVSAIGVDIVPAEWRRYGAASLADEICKRHEYWFNYSAEQTMSLCGESEAYTETKPAESVAEQPLDESNSDSGADIDFTITDVFYDVNEFLLTIEQKALLEPLVRHIAGMESPIIVIQGYADTSGFTQWNSRLSNLRTRSIADYLTAKFGDTVRILEEPQGETQRFSEAELPLNRRVQIKVLPSIQSDAS